MNPLMLLGMGTSLFTGLMSLFSQDAQNQAQLRAMKLQHGQEFASATGAAASSGIETTGGGSKGTQTFLDTMGAEFKREEQNLEFQQNQAQIARGVGMVGSMGGQAAAGAFNQMNANKSGVTFTPSMNVPSMQLTQSNFVQGNLSGPSWGN